MNYFYVSKFCSKIYKKNKFCPLGIAKNLVSRFVLLPRMSLMEDVVLISTAEILPRSADVIVNVEHDPPALRGECYPLRVQITNKENQTISNVELAVSISEGRIHNMPKIDTNCSSFIKLSMDQIGSNQTSEWFSFFTQMEQPGTHTFTFEVISHSSEAIKFDSQVNRVVVFYVN